MIIIGPVEGATSQVRILSPSIEWPFAPWMFTKRPGAVGLMAIWARVNGQVSHTVFREKKVCQNLVPVTFIPTAHAQQSLVAKVFKSSDRSIHQGANIQVPRHTLFVLFHINWERQS